MAADPTDLFAGLIDRLRHNTTVVVIAHRLSTLRNADRIAVLDGGRIVQFGTWQALTRDRRFAGQFKRQTLVGRHIPDFVSFVHRTAIELVNAGEGDAIVRDRAVRRAWLESRGYRVVDIKAADVEASLDRELARLETDLRGS